MKNNPVISNSIEAGASDMSLDCTPDQAGVIRRVIRRYPALIKQSYGELQALIDSGAINVPAEEAEIETPAQTLS